jgi:hypothetical protein
VAAAEVPVRLRAALAASRVVVAAAVEVLLGEQAGVEVMAASL